MDPTAGRRMEAAQPPGVGADRGSALLPQGPSPGTERAYAAPKNPSLLPSAARHHQNPQTSAAGLSGVV